MKKIAILIISMLCVSVYAQDTLRIMTINIHQGSDTTLQAIGEFIKQCHPDLVAVQELDMWPKRPEAPRQRDKNFIAELSYHADMMGYFGKAWDHPGGWLYGDGFLVKYPTTKIESFILPHNKNLRGSEPRVLCLAHMNINGNAICFGSTHLCHMNRDNRVAQMKVIRQIMRKQKEPFKIVCGDLNSDPSENAVNTVMKNWVDALPEDRTFPSDGKPYAKYDYILMDKKSNIQVINYFYMCDYGITDHCACVVDLVLNPKKSKKSGR